MNEVLTKSDVFLKGLELMGIGMAGIFIVLIIIYFTIKLLGVLFPEK